MLVRSNSLNSMNSQPKDVVDEFVRLSVDAGINVFTNFDANNDPRNHRAVAEAVHKYGQHYQAALSWAVYHPDPTIYNVQWAVNWFRQIVRDLKPHSLYVKDPSGVLTPEMAGALSKEIKAAFPDLPLIFHSHYQTGFAYAAYLEAMRNGANGVECSLGFPDGAGQPYGLAMLRMVEDYGLETGNPNKQKWHDVNMFCKTVLRPLYPNANVVRTPDIQVEQTGIAGGQRSILDKELIDAGQAHLIPTVDSMVQQVRKEGGLVCQVTPAADSYAREAMRRIRGGNPAKNFTPGYAQILYGENGSTKEPINDAQKKAALDERVVKRVAEMAKEKKISKEAADALTGADKKDSKEPTALSVFRAHMDKLSEPVIRAQRKTEVKGRLEELKAISSKPELLKPLEIKIQMAQKHAAEGSVEAKVGSLADRVAILQAELAALEKASAGVNEAQAEKTYHSILLGSAPDSEFRKIAELSPVSRDLLASEKITISNLKDILSHAGTITCSAADLLENSMEKARVELEAFEQQHCLGLLDTPQKRSENTLLWACFSKAAIPNLIENFFLNYYTGDIAGFFPKLFKGDKEGSYDPLKSYGSLKRDLEKAAAKNEFLYRNIHRNIEQILRHHPDSSAIVTKVKELRQQADQLALRAKKWEDGSVESSRITADTKTKVQQKIDSLRAEADKGQEVLNERVLSAIRTNKGKLKPTYPVYNAAEGTIDYTADVHEAVGKRVKASPEEEVEFSMAKVALGQIIHHK
jgi:pyruvate/oxaloacetate carboxyltransferase